MLLDLNKLTFHVILKQTQGIYDDFFLAEL